MAHWRLGGAIQFANLAWISHDCTPISALVDFRSQQKKFHRCLMSFCGAKGDLPNCRIDQSHFRPSENSLFLPVSRYEKCDLGEIGSQSRVKLDRRESAALSDSFSTARDPSRHESESKKVCLKSFLRLLDLAFVRQKSTSNCQVIFCKKKNLSTWFDRGASGHRIVSLDLANGNWQASPKGQNSTTGSTRS